MYVTKIVKDKTIEDNLMYRPNYDKQNNPYVD